jgi:hypothetical protein
MEKFSEEKRVVAVAFHKMPVTSSISRVLIRPDE